jgi:tetratricopeptide (TPR) repeat protein
MMRVPAVSALTGRPVHSNGGRRQLTVGSDTISRSPSERRWAWGLVVPILVAGIVGASAWWMWPRRPDRDPMRLGLLRSALEEFNAGRHERAAAILARRQSEGVATSLDWMLRARVAEAQGQLAGALGYLGHIPDADRIGPQARLKAGQIERARHRLRAAEAAFVRAMAIDPDLVQAHRELAYIYALQHRKADCDAQFAGLARLIPLDYKMAFAWGQNEYEIFEPNEAIKALIPAVAADPDDRWSRLALARDYRAIFQYDRAEEIIGPLPDSDPDARAIRAQLALDRHDPAVAEALIREGPADHPRLNALRGRMVLQRGEPARAAEYFGSALAREPGDRDAAQGLGIALQALRDPRASEYLRIAALHDQAKRIIVECGQSPRIDVKVLPRLGEICESLGRSEQARVWYRVAIAWNPEDSQAHQGLTRLDGARP